MKGSTMPSAKIAARLPKGDRDGLNPVADAIAEHPGERRVYVVVMHAQTVEHDTTSGDDTLKLAIDQIELIDRDADRIDAAMVREIMLRAQQRRNGRRILPFELRANLEALFPNLITDDERELREDEEMSSAERLRRHLERVHGFNGVYDDRPKAGIFTDREVIEKHREDHEHAQINHPTSFDGWTRSERDALPHYLLAWSETDAVWAVLDRIGGRVFVCDPGPDQSPTEVDAARKWATDRIEATTTRTVIRWRNSDVVDGAWVPVLDDGPAQSDSAGPDPEGDPTLFDDPDSLTGGSAGPVGEAVAPEADPESADSASSFESDEADTGGDEVADAQTESPDETADTEPVEPVPAAVFSAPEPEGGVDLDGDTRKPRTRRGSA
jgi:hypothetical protein